MTVQVSCLLIAAAALCLWRAAAAAFGDRNDAGRWNVSEDWGAIMVFALANLAALMGGLDPAGSWSLASPLWVAAFVLQGLFSLSGQKALRLTTFLIGLAMSGWIFFMALQWV